jgi:hypothetical protein
MLDTFHGDLVYYRVFGCMCSPGVHYVFSTCGGWLVSDIIVFQHRRVKLRRCEWQRWRLEVGDVGSAILKCTNAEARVVFRHKYAYVDFPVDHFELHAVVGEVEGYGRCRILVLPGED